jgi:hypothetical protein
VGPSAQPINLGEPLLRRPENHFKHAAKIARNFRIGEAKDLISSSTEHEVSICVVSLVMGVAVDFNDQRTITADEVADEALDDDLPAELESAELAASQALPQSVLKWRGLGSHITSE